jgi:hypothetical protein
LIIKFCYKGFSIQSKIIDLLIRGFNITKNFTTSLEASRREIIFLLRRYLLLKKVKQSVRLILFFSILGVSFILL